MKASHILNILLGGALIVVSALWYNGQRTTDNRPQTTADEPPEPVAFVLQNIETRATVRMFKKDEVPDMLVGELLHAGMAAPTALNAQPWHFIVIRDRDVLKSLSVASPHTGVLADAPLAIAVCGDMNKKLKSAEGVYWQHDVCAATENILLAAHGLGLGATWTGCYPVEERYQLARKVLSLPDNIVPVSIIAIGYPAMSVEPKDKWKPENVSYR